MKEYWDYVIMEKIISQLYRWKKEKIELTDLEILIKPDDYLQFTEKIAELERILVIKPVRSSRENGRNPSLYRRYHILKKELACPETMNEIRSLHYWIANEKFLKNPDKYIASRKLIYTLSEFLKSAPEALKEPSSENERAYEIWGDEKMLDEKDNIKILKECSVFHRLNTYPTPEPFFDYRRTASPQNVLVIENKDPWFTIRKLMMEHPSMYGLFDTNIDCIVYGEGNKITKKQYSLTEYLNIHASFHGKVYYWGDMDFEGIDIFLSAVKGNPDLQIIPFYAAYAEMLKQFAAKLNSMADKSLLKGHDHQAMHENIADFYCLFEGEISENMKNLMNNHFYIPQEILNYRVLKHNIKIMESII